MKKVFRYFTMMLAIGGATLTSCLDKEEIVNNQKEQYQDNWVKVFGNIDPDHDWSVAKQVNATFNLAGVVSGEHTARIYTEHPYNKKCKLLAEFKVNGSGTVSFDTEKTTKHVYIRVENAEGQMAFDGYFTIEGNELVADSRTIAGRSLSRATPNENYFDAHTIGSVQRDGKEELNEIKQDNSTTTTVDLGTIYYPKSPIQSSGEVTIGFNDYLIPIVNNSNTAIFQEFKDNRTKTSTQGVEYVTITNGEVQLDYVFGMTGLYNTIGYFYWNPNNGGTYTDAPKIVLLEDAEPDHILKGKFYENGEERIEDFSETAQTDNQYGMVLNQYVRGNKTPPTQLIGQSYKLLYYGEDYQSAGTTTFPAGTHIGFFLYTNYWDTSRTSNNQGSPYSSNGDYAYGRQNPKEVETNSTYRTNLVYSIPAYNQAIKESYNYRINESDYQQQNGNQNYNVNIDKGEISAVTYNYQGKTILGFEDGVDKDMNDILFVVNANVEVAGGEVVNLGGSNNTPQTQSWIIACEDLGSVGDYDFNDAVFSVSHVGGSDQLTVTPLAAGGTYPIKLLYNGQPVRDEDFHQLIDGSANKQGDLWKPINADTKGTAGNSITITNVPENYSINQHGFSVEVEKNEGTSITIKQSMVDNKEQKAPQMLILPGNWIWPKESMPIHSGYPRFAQWNADQQQHTDWYTNNNEHNDIAENKLVGSYGNQGGSGGTGGDIPEVEEPDVTNYGISITVDGQNKGTIETQNDNNYYLELPKEYFATSGTTTITLNGANESGNNLEIRLGDAQLVWTSTNTMQLDASKVTGNVRLYIWDGSATQFSKINSIDITNNGGGNVEPENPSDNIEVSGFKGELIEGYTIYTIPVLDAYKASDVTGIKVTVTLTSTKTSHVAFFSDKNNYSNHNVHSSQQIQAGQSYEFTINKDKYQDLSNIYTGTQDQDAGIASISVEVVKTATPTTVTLQITGGATSTLTLEGNEGNYYVTIPAGTFGNNGATIEFTSSDQNSQIQNVTVGGQNGYTTVENRNGYLKIEVPSSMVNSSNATTIRLPKTVTSIVITNKGNTSSGDGITFTVDGVAKSNLTINGQYFAIPTSVFTGNNGATIYIDATSADYSAELKDVNNTNIIQGQIKGNATLSADQVSSIKSKSEIRLYLYHNAAAITGIRIVNNNSDVTEPEPEPITISITVNGNSKGTLEVGQNNQFTIPLNNYGLGSNGATITFNGNATIQINGQTQNINGSWDYEVSSYSDLSVTITSGTIDSIVITNKEKPSGGGTNTDWMSYCSADKKTATIPKSDLPIGNNGISISLNISKETNIIVGQAIQKWENSIQGYGTSFTKTISQAEINKISGDNIVIWLNAADATITNIEISAAN